MENLHIGNLIKKQIDSRKIAKSALARKIKKKDATILYYLRQATLKTDIILNLSIALKHNFFQDLADLLPSSYSAARPETDMKDATIAQLQEEIKILKAEKEVLLQVLGK